MATEAPAAKPDKGPERPLLLWLLLVVLVNIPGMKAAHAGQLEAALQGRSRSGSCAVTRLVLRERLITLDQEDRRALAACPRLEELRLDGNAVSRLPARYFAVVPRLRALSLARNKIRSLDPESFSGLDVLTELDLSNNLLTRIQTALFRRLRQVQVLRLTGNPWNCSCPLLKTAGDGRRADGQQVRCASLKSREVREFMQVTSACGSPTRSRSKRDQTQPVTAGFPQPPSSLGTRHTTGRSHGAVEEPTPVLSNTWKFTACVASLALCTLTVVACAIKGPSWYKLLHNYRHRRLDQEEDADIVSRVFARSSRSLTNQTFTFTQQNGPTEEELEEDGYLEDLFTKREGGGEAAKQEEAKS